MSSGGSGDYASGHNEKLSSLRAILGDEIPAPRLIQILEASNGSIEHAIEIYFGQMQQISRPVNDEPKRNISPKTASSESRDRPHQTSPNKTGGKRNRGKISSPDNSQKGAKTKQVRLDAFFGVNSNNNTGLSCSKQKTAEGSTKQLNDTTKETISLKTEDLVNTKSPYSSRGMKITSEPVAKLVNVDVNSKASGLKKPNHDRANSSSLLSFQRLCETLQEMTDTTKRLVKLKAVETLIREIIDSKSNTNPSSDSKEKCDISTKARTISSALELILGGMTSKPLNVSGSAVSKALQTSLGISRNQISKAYRQYGDIGCSAASFFQKKTHFLISSDRHKLSICQVAEGLRNISEVGGREAKQHIILKLLRRCESKIECRFLVRLLVQNMRIGASMKTILAALAMAMMPTSCDEGKDNEKNDNKNIYTAKDAIALVQKTHDICPSIPKVVSALLEGGFDQMKRECSIQVMTPIAPMLAHPIHSLSEIKSKMDDSGNEATMEWKYDGMRCQAHFDGSNIQLFSRHMLNMTDQFPDVVNCLKEAMKIKVPCDDMSFVIDSEIVGVEGEGVDSRLLPFQDLSTRRKKMDDGNGIRVKVFAFDLMFLNGNSLINEELFKRISMLREIFTETSDFSLVSSQKLDVYDESKITSFLSEAIENGAEGLMIKLLGRMSTTEENTKGNILEKSPMNSLYEAGTRSHSWLKVKRDYVAGFSDTIDVVPIGAWWGSGRKAQKSFLSPILLAVYDDEEDVYRSICRCMSFTDAMYESIREFYFNGIKYPPCSSDSRGTNNQNDDPQQKVSSNNDAIIEENNSCDEHEDKNANDEDSLCDSFQDEAIDGHANGTDRINCFPARPSSAFVVTNESPPIWFKPMEVFEVAFADLSLSRQHTAAAGMVDETGRGVALRFPRFKRRRPDKKPEQATTSIEIAQLFAKQSKIKNGSRSLKPNG